MSTAYLTSIVPVKWPERPVLPGYNVVTLRTMKEIEAVFADAIEAGKTEFSFDFETAPTEEEFARIRAEANSIANDDPENAEALIQELLKSLGQAPFDPHRAYPCTMSFCFDLYTCYLVWPDTRPGVGYLAPETVIPYCIKKARNAGMEIIAYNMAFEAKFCAKYDLAITGKVVDPFMCIVRTLQVVKWDEIADPKSPAYKKGLKPMSKQ